MTPAPVVGGAAVVAALAWAVLGAGCASPSPCTPAELEALVTGCEVHMETTPDQAEALAVACEASVEAWRVRCGGGK